MRRLGKAVMHLLSPGLGDAPFAGFGIVFVVMVVLAIVFFLGVVAVIVVLIARNAKKARQAGFDPLTMNTELAARALNSELLQPAKSVEQRLAEIDDLRARGVISAEERESARAEILRG